MTAITEKKATTATMALSWPQVHAWRLAQHGLSPRFNLQDVVQAVTRTGGIQAQVMSAAELALCTRVDGLTQQHVRSALWQERTLVKTWAMRGTLHLLVATDLPLYVAARDFRDTDTKGGWAAYYAEYGLTPTQRDAFRAAAPEVLGREPLTRQQLAEALARETGVAHLRDFILSTSWGSPLKPAAYRGELCCGPSQGQNVTFVNPKKWIGVWRDIEPHQAQQEIARRYLRAYGPATADDFAVWWGIGKTSARKLFQSLGDELEQVVVEGWRAYVLRATLEPMARIEPTQTVHLLPLFDAYTIGAPRDREPLLNQVHKSKVFRQQGWVSAVVVINGSMQGVWRHSVRRAQTTIRVQLFSRPTVALRKGIAAEAERLGAIFNTPITLEYEMNAAM